MALPHLHVRRTAETNQRHKRGNRSSSLKVIITGATTHLGVLDRGVQNLRQAGTGHPQVRRRGMHPWQAGGISITWPCNRFFSFTSDGWALPVLTMVASALTIALEGGDWNPETFAGSLTPEGAVCGRFSGLPVGCFRTLVPGFCDSPGSAGGKRPSQDMNYMHG